MKILITIFITLFVSFHSFAQAIPSFLPKWRNIEEDTTIKNKLYTFYGIPRVYKQDKDKNIYVLSETGIGYQLSKIEAKTGKKLWSVGRNQSFGTEDKVYFPKDFFFRPDGNIVLFAVKGLKFPALFAGGLVIKCVYDAQTGKELFSLSIEKIGGSAVTINNGALVQQIIVKPDQTGYYYADGLSSPKNLTWIRTVDTNFVANDTLLLKVPSADTSKGLQLFNLSPFHQINRKFYQMSAHFGGNDTSRFRTYFHKIDYLNKQYSVRDVSKYLFHGISNVQFDMVKDGFIASVQADTAYRPSQGLSFRPNNVLAKIDTNGTLIWRTYLFPTTKPYFGFCQVVEDNKTDGYWVVLSSEEDSGKPFLYYMSNKGNLKLIGSLTLPDKTFMFSSYIPTMLDNGDILIVYRTQANDPHPEYAFHGTLYYERKQFEPFITKDDNIAITPKNISVYPNPVEHRLQVLLPTVTAFEYVISDMMGRIVKRESVEATNFYEIATQDFPKGIYLLSIKTTDNQVFVQKIVKQ